MSTITLEINCPPEAAHAIADHLDAQAEQLAKRRSPPEGLTLGEAIAVYGLHRDLALGIRAVTGADPRKQSEDPRDEPGADPRTVTGDQVASKGLGAYDGAPEGEGSTDAGS